MKDALKEIYEKLLIAYKAGNEDMFEANVRNWMAAEDENPFPAGTEGSELFFRIKIAYRVWKSNAINSRSSRVRMLKLARALAEKNIPNPYDVSNSHSVREKNDQKPQAATKNEEVAETKTTHILGVLPGVEDKAVETLKEQKTFFGRKKKKADSN